MPLDWNDVHLFLAVVHAGSLRAAARECGVDVSTVSRRLTQLENAAGERLLRRDARKLSLTQAGTHVLESAERMAGEVSTLTRKLAQGDRRVGGLLRVTTPSPLAHLVARAFAELARNHPALELELITQDALLDIDGLTVDIALRIAEAPPENLVGQRVARLHGGLYASKGYLREHPEPLSHRAHSWVDWDRRLMHKPAFSWLAQQWPERRVAARGLTTHDVHALLRAGAGIGALPDVLAAADGLLTRLCDVPSELASSVWLLTHPELRTVPRVRAVLRAIKQVVASEKARL